MEDHAAEEEGEAEIQELHGPKHWFSQWKWQWLAAQMTAPKQQKLWHFFQNSVTAVVQFYK
ncbi:PREDICTED: UPF0472 protein C16orf72 homolog, partial [Thamnophis sirtalis]|uniref:UPF0472 protein C16orf72 homolog n=1 Tax=Thamnophis sirtalis TaxID=35019 RepID=A0A6I9XN33_9SAUR